MTKYSVSVLCTSLRDSAFLNCIIFSAKCQTKKHSGEASPKCPFSMDKMILGNTAQRLCDRCVVKFFVRWNKKRSEYLMYSRAFLWNMRVCFVSDVCRLRRQIFWEMKGKTEKILYGFSSIFPKYLGKYARKMRAGRYETGSDEKFASRWRAKSPDALCAVLPWDNTANRLRNVVLIIPVLCKVCTVAM